MSFRNYSEAYIRKQKKGPRVYFPPMLTDAEVQNMSESEEFAYNAQLQPDFLRDEKFELIKMLHEGPIMPQRMLVNTARRQIGIGPLNKYEQERENRLFKDKKLNYLEKDIKFRRKQLRRSRTYVRRVLGKEGRKRQIAVAESKGGRKKTVKFTNKRVLPGEVIDKIYSFLDKDHRGDNLIDWPKSRPV